MNTSVKYKKMLSTEEKRSPAMEELVKDSFRWIAPFWPLQNLVAVNPFQGLEAFPIEEAIKIGSAYFQRPDLPTEMALVNIETIKWLQAYCDKGQATIVMPLRKYGLYNAWRKLAPYDEKLHKNKKKSREFLNALPKIPEQAINECLLHLGIPKEDQGEFLTLLLTTLPGWASHVKYKSASAGGITNEPYRLTQVDYVAVRLIITTLLWPKAKKLLGWHQEALQTSDSKTILEKIQAAENAYRLSLLKKIATQRTKKKPEPKAQLIFCIDVRSEPFRKNLEATGDYQTFGFAGFFGIQAQITDKITGNSYSSCPVLLEPKHHVTEAPGTLSECLQDEKEYEFLSSLKRLYQSLKYNFSTPFVLVEALGAWSGAWMALKTTLPKIESKFRGWITNFIRNPKMVEPSLEGISFEEQCVYAEDALRMMGLTSHFAPLVVFCGHGSSTQNNAYAAALDCGACGGQRGGSNAKILAAIMNRSEVQVQLSKNGIHIPKTTQFIAAEHNTTTDEVKLYCKHETEAVQKLKHHLEVTRKNNCARRLKHLDSRDCSVNSARLRAEDWAQVRPEWGLARNAAFIVAPRDFTSSIDLEGRCFLHSYDHTQDPQGVWLAKILTGPMVVAEWINLQYLFSTIDNVAYGGGSKVTKNITGKIAVMQGNASDLMTGLPLQSVYKSDKEPYHEPQRLMVLVLASQVVLDKIIQDQPVLQKLLGNGWVQMGMIEPINNEICLLNRDFSWEKINQYIHVRPAWSDQSSRR